MIILFSPSEEKHNIYNTHSNNKFGFMDSLLFGKELKEWRLHIANDYLEFLRTAPSTDIMRIFGTKNIKMDMLNACSNMDCANTIESILLYNGVAFKALDVKSLDKNSLEFLYQNVIIFSNLFGAIRASDKIPYYKMQQGEAFRDNNIKKIYSGFKDKLKLYLENDDVLDLRAEFYIKAYKLDFPHTKMEFYKDNKKSTHYAKHYKGLALRYIALNGNFNLPFRLRNTKQDGYSRILQYDV